MKQRVRHIKSAKMHVILTALLITVALLSLLVIGRGWIRGSALAWYGTRVAGSSVNDAYDSSFTDFNERLKTDGVTFHTVHTQNIPCKTTAYHGIRVTVECLKASTAYATVPDEAVADWHGLYLTLTSHMTGGKSSISSLSNTSDPDNLFVYQEHLKGVPANVLHLDGQVGKVSCSIDMTVSPAHDTVSQSGSRALPTEVLMSESCQRDIHVFGGWDCTKQYCKQGY